MSAHEFDAFTAGLTPWVRANLDVGTRQRGDSDRGT